LTNGELQKYLISLSDGDRAAFEKIYENLSTPMYTIILRITHDRSLSEDILQEVFVKLYLSPPTSAGNPRAYLFQMAHNLAVDGARKNPQFVDLEDCEKLAGLPADDFSQRMEIEDALESLPSAECNIVSLHINGGFKFREISDILGIPLGTVIWRYHRAIKSLRSYLSGGNTL